MTAAKPTVIPCAIYTRKSSEEGLEQDFNSLDAQRESCAAFIQSQKAQGWKAVGTAYDDGGFSGGNTERPALKRLLTDIAAKKIRIIVVYKVDRLTRSLADFAKLVELFDAHGVSFVSVTQQFSTTSSMGRLTLNVLLSFAQFEREVTGERIRDKIAASKRKGMWMGGIAPIGYLPHERSLMIDEPRADQVRAIYRLYEEFRCVRRLKAELDRRGWRTPARKTHRADAAGGCAFSRGHLYRILSNPVYLGRIVHKDQVYDGQHPAIVDETLWTVVQDRLASNAPSRGGGPSASHASLLRSRLYDAANRRLSPSHARKGAQRYRYYVRPAVIESDGAAAERALRIPAAELETAVVQTITTLLNDRPGLLDLTGEMSATDTTARLERAAAVAKALETAHTEDRPTLVRALVSRVTVHAERITVTINLGAVWGAAEPIVEREVPARLRRCGMAMRLVVEGSGGVDRAVRRGPDPRLVGLLSRAHEWLDQLKSGRAGSVQAIATAVGIRGDQATRIVHLAFLAPDVTERILRGDHPPDLTATRLLEFVPLLAPRHNILFCGMSQVVLPDQAVCGVAEQLTLFLRARNEQNPNDVYVGHVTLPSGRRRSRAFVKMFPPQDRNQLVYNEIIGHYLALQCGLPSPLTFPCACHRSLLRRASLPIMAPDARSPFVMGVASVDGNAKALQQAAASSAAVWADVMNWPHVAHVAVFDELMGNDDRHLENLIRRGRHDYTLIDNERILFGEPWFKLDLNELRTRRCDANVLADTIAEGTDEIMRRRMLDVAQHLLMQTLLHVPEVAQSMEEMCGAPVGTTERLVEMLNQRRTLLPSLLQWHLQKGDLFQASTNR